MTQADPCVLSCRCTTAGLGWAIADIENGSVHRCASGFFSPKHEVIVSAERTHVMAQLVSLVNWWDVNTILYPAGVPTSRAVALPQMLAAVRGIASDALDTSQWKGALRPNYAARLCRRLLKYECESAEEADALAIAVVYLSRSDNTQPEKVA